MGLLPAVALLVAGSHTFLCSLLLLQHLEAEQLC
jgi:hypothetical protein